MNDIVYIDGQVVSVWSQFITYLVAMYGVPNVTLTLLPIYIEHVQIYIIWHIYLDHMQYI